jgi:hypothetical protein
MRLFSHASNSTSVLISCPHNNLLDVHICFCYSNDRRINRQYLFIIEFDNYGESVKEKIELRERLMQPVKSWEKNL